MESQTSYSKFTYDHLIKGLKYGNFKNILVMTGPGIDESIQDLRQTNFLMYL